MPVATVRGASINYETLGDTGPWVALMPGGRGDLEQVRVLGTRIADAGHRVLLHDRRNCGASDIVIEGDDSEQEIWADDLYELLGQVGGLPAFVGGGSAGCRVALLLAIRHPEAVRGLLLYWVSGGAVGAERLGDSYYSQFIELARTGGMTAVSESDFFTERIAANASNRERLLAAKPRDFIATMSRWRDSFTLGAELPVIGATEEQLRAITVPTSIVPGHDDVHPQAVGEHVHSLIPTSELHYLYSEEEQAALPSSPTEESMRDRQERLAAVFTGFLANVRSAAGAVSS